MTEAIRNFRKSSHSGQQGDCVEVAVMVGGGRAVRDSKQQSGPLLTVSSASWQAFVRQFGRGGA